MGYAATALVLLCLGLGLGFGPVASARHQERQGPSNPVKWTKVGMEHGVLIGERGTGDYTEQLTLIYTPPIVHGETITSEHVVNSPTGGHVWTATYLVLGEEHDHLKLAYAEGYMEKGQQTAKGSERVITLPRIDGSYYFASRGGGSFGVRFMVTPNKPRPGLFVVEPVIDEAK